MATLAELSDPTGVKIDASGNVYIADFGNERIRFVTSTELVSSINTISEKIDLYPNPSSGSFTLNVSSSTYEQIDFVITNALGQKVKEGTIITNSPLRIQLDVPPGVYLLSAITANSKLNRTINVIK